MSENEKLAKNLSGNNSAFAPKPGCAILPKSRLSLWAAILALAGAVGLLGYRLYDIIVHNSSLTNLVMPARLFELLEFLFLMTVAILFFTARASGKSLKVPSLIWAIGTLFMMPSAIYAFIQLMRQYDLFLAYYYLLINVMPFAAALFAILYAFKALKELPFLIIIGILLGAVIIAGTYFNLTMVLGFSKSPYVILPFDTIYIRYAFILLYYLLFPTGIFLAVLASKPKATE